MAEPFIGEIRAFGFNFAPRGWAQCNGQLLQISQNTALFSLLGTTYGGDGRTTFALPDLRGCSAVHQGTGPGLQNKQMGQRGGVESIQLSIANMPPHNHRATLHAEAAAASVGSPISNMLAFNRSAQYAPVDPANDVSLAPSSIVVDNAGGGQSFIGRGPYQVVNCCIALTGIFPSRN